MQSDTSFDPLPLSRRIYTGLPAPLLGGCSIGIAPADRRYICVYMIRLEYRVYVIRNGLYYLKACLQYMILMDVYNICAYNMCVFNVQVLYLV